MQVAVWIIIILVIIFLIWLLRRWIRRLIFILILLILAFFIYGIFSPSGAARLRYNVRTFPQRMASWMGSGSEILDYDSYKSKISSIGDKIGEKINIGGDDENEDLDVNDGSDVKLDETELIDDEVKAEDTEKDSSNTEKTVKSFPKSVKFIEIPELKVENKQNKQSEDYRDLTGYSKSDLIGVINKYIERNLDDDTNILVTVEYEDDSTDPQKIILQTQSKDSLDGSVDVYDFSSSDSLLDDLFSKTESKN